MEEMRGKRSSGPYARTESVFTGIVSTGLAMVVVALANILASRDLISSISEHWLNLLAVVLFGLPPVHAALRARSGASIKLSVAMGAFLLTLHECIQLVNNAYPGTAA